MSSVMIPLPSRYSARAADVCSAYQILEEGGAPLQELLKAPSYEDHAGKLYNHDGASAKRYPLRALHPN